MTEALWEEYEAFSKRELSAFDVVYLFCDAVYESLRQQAGCRQAILVTWGICSDGAKVLLHMSLGNKESGENWLEHFRSLAACNLPTPITVTTDGRPGLIKAVEAMWPEAERIRCVPQDEKRAGESARRSTTLTAAIVPGCAVMFPIMRSGVKRVEELIENHQGEL